MKKASLQRQRILAGLCPTCGKESAPYYLCADHRFQKKIEHILKRATKSNALTVERKGRSNYYSLGDEAAFRKIKWRADPKDSDKRLRPRLGRVVVDVEDELYRLLSDMGRPATIEEIVQAWGRLREKRKTGSLAGDINQIITAERKRQQRNAKRLLHAKRMTEARA